MIYIILSILIILGLIFPKSKCVIILDILTLGIVIGFRSYLATDYVNYWDEYNTASLIPFSQADFPGYNILMRACQYLGFNFRQFCVFIAFLSLILMIIGMLRISRFVPFALSLFLIYPFAHEAVQMRTFLANSIVWFALPFLLIDYPNKKKNLRKKLVFFLLIYIATTIHTLSWFYFIISIIYLLIRKYKRYFSIFISFIFLMMIFIHTNMLGRIMMSLSSSDKLNHWVEGSTSYGVLVYMIITILIYILLKYSTETIIKSGSSVWTTQTRLNIQKFSITVIAVIPFLTFDITFNRLWRVFLGLLYLLSGEYIYNNNNLKLKKVLYILSLILVVLIMFLLEHETEILNTLVG